MLLSKWFTFSAILSIHIRMHAVQWLSSLQIGINCTGFSDAYFRTSLTTGMVITHAVHNETLFFMTQKLAV